MPVRRNALTPTVPACVEVDLELRWKQRAWRATSRSTTHRYLAAELGLTRVPYTVYRMPYTEPRSDFLQLLLELLRHSFVVVNARGLGALA